MRYVQTFVCRFGPEALLDVRENHPAASTWGELAEADLRSADSDDYDWSLRSVEIEWETSDPQLDEPLPQLMGYELSKMEGGPTQGGIGARNIGRPTLTEADHEANKD